MVISGKGLPLGQEYRVRSIESGVQFEKISPQVSAVEDNFGVMLFENNVEARK